MCRHTPTPLVSRRALLLVSLVALMGALLSSRATAATPKYVISISVDGLGSSYLQTLIDQGQAPNFKRFQTEGSWTNNARNDPDVTVTLPNHTTMLTGRGVRGASGHNYTNNVDPEPGVTLHSNKGAYLASVFDVAHDHGLRTCLYTGKTKFSLYKTSYDADHGAADPGAVDHGRNKIDRFVCNGNSVALVRDFAAATNEKPFDYSFIHFADPDAAGHPFGWGGSRYMAAIRNVDKCLGMIFQLVQTNPILRGRTEIILTSDHGGKDHNHVDNMHPLIYTIPFYVWGPQASPGKDLYALNRSSRLDPGVGRPLFAAPVQPIRNGDGANLALKLLGLGIVPGSTINTRQDLLLDDASTARAETVLSYADLVRRMTDVERLAVLPLPGETAAQCSSYDRASKYDPKTGKYIAWDANGDGVAPYCLPPAVERDGYYEPADAH